MIMTVMRGLRVIIIIMICDFWGGSRANKNQTNSATRLFTSQKVYAKIHSIRRKKSENTTCHGVVSICGFGAGC
jgi:hypothetical protein